MPKTYGAKEKDQVVAHIFNQVLTGKLRTRRPRRPQRNRHGIRHQPRPHSRSDRSAGTRRGRCRPAITGARSSSASTKRLSASITSCTACSTASPRRAPPPTPPHASWDSSTAYCARCATARNRAPSNDAAREYRRAVDDEYAGPRLHAAIRASQGLIPRAFLLSYPSIVAEMLPFYEDETAAIRHRDPEGARAACTGCADLMAEVMLTELVRRGVLAPSDKAAGVF